MTIQNDNNNYQQQKTDCSMFIFRAQFDKDGHNPLKTDQVHSDLKMTTSITQL